MLLPSQYATTTTCLIFLFFIATAPNAQTFLKQSYIDSCINQAYYYLNATDDPATGIKMERAIEMSRAISQKLKNAAKEDVNRKYILSKVAELDAQLYLEEKGLLEEKQYYRQKTSNDIIAGFNSELGKPRPSFTILADCFNSVNEIDNVKAEEIQRSIYSRRTAVFLLVQQSINRAMEENNMTKAQEELSYLQANREYLGVSLSQYASIAGKFQSKSNVNDLKTYITATMETCRKAIDRIDLVTARQDLRIISTQIDELRRKMHPVEWERLHQEYERINNKEQRKEDSLVNIANGYFDKKGVSVAGEYIDTLRLYGVAREKVSLIEKEFLEKAIIESRQESSSKKSLISAFIEAEDTTETVSALDDLLLSAKQKAKAKQDSILLAEKSNVQLTQVEEVRRDRLKVAQDMRNRHEQDVKKQRAVEAQTELITIYSLLHQDKKKDAAKHFNNVKNLLKETLSVEEYKKIESSLGEER